MDNTLFDCLADFVEAAGEENKLLIIFLYHLSKYQAVANLPASITNIETSWKKQTTGCISPKPNIRSKRETSIPPC